VSPIRRKKSGQTGFRWKVMLAMMALVAGITGIAIYAVQRNLAAEVSASLRRDFEEKLATLHSVQEVRHGVLTERCRVLARKPRIHAALEDNALDLLYPSAQEELRDVLDPAAEPPATALDPELHAQFYRFLNSKGAVLSPPNAAAIGPLMPEEERQLALAAIPRSPQLGYILRSGSAETVSEVIAVPIISTETGERISALVLGFKPLDFGDHRGRGGVRNGVWLQNRLHLPGLSSGARATLEKELISRDAPGKGDRNSFTVEIDGIRHLLFYKLLNPGSLYAPAYEVCIFPLSDLLARQGQLRWQILSGAGIMLLVGFAASHYFAGRLSVPVEMLAVDSELNRAHREQAEAALELTTVELQRSARFSADASHQLKTPVTVMRAGLEELLARENLNPELREEVSDLIHQSFRLSGVVDDLLLLSRMDAGRLQLNLKAVNLSLLLETELDDLTARPNDFDLQIESDLSPGIFIAGEKRYTMMIVRNLLENARKYNRLNGRIRVSVKMEGEAVRLLVANTAQPIPPEAQGRIFERFHRGAAGENVPGHGLGLNLARELAKLHGGDLRLLRSDSDGTVFEARFRVVSAEIVGI
jgi:signal transduction histidine kinase